jgi:hypothetical protein
VTELPQELWLLGVVLDDEGRIPVHELMLFGLMGLKAKQVRIPHLAGVLASSVNPTPQSKWLGQVQFQILEVPLNLKTPQMIALIDTIYTYVLERL